MSALYFGPWVANDSSALGYFPRFLLTHFLLWYWREKGEGGKWEKCKCIKSSNFSEIFISLHLPTILAGNKFWRTLVVPNGTNQRDYPPDSSLILSPSATFYLSPSVSRNIYFPFCFSYFMPFQESPGCVVFLYAIMTSLFYWARSYLCFLSLSWFAPFPSFRFPCFRHRLVLQFVLGYLSDIVGLALPLPFLFPLRAQYSLGGLACEGPILAVMNYRKGS